LKKNQKRERLAKMILNTAFLSNSWYYLEKEQTVLERKRTISVDGPSSKYPIFRKNITKEKN